MTGDATTDALIAGFEARTLEKANWTHAAHVTTALAYVRALGRDEALRRIRTNIRAYNAAVGGPANAYHETITRAWITVVARFLAAREPDMPFGAMLEALLARCGTRTTC